MEHDARQTLAVELAALLADGRSSGAALGARVQERLGLEAGAARQLVFDATADAHARLFPPLTQIELVLTEGCNLACSYCFEKDMLGFRRMPDEVALQAVELLLVYSRGAPDLDIALFGGEPTLAFPLIRRLVARSRERARETGQALHFNMTSNGVLIDDAMAAECAALGIRVMLSLDGREAAHDLHRRDKKGRGTYARALAGLQALRRHQPWVGIKMTVMPENVELLADDVIALHDLGVCQFTIGHATGVPWPEERMQAYAAQMARLSAWYAPRRGSDALRIDELEGRESDAPYFGCQAGRSSVSVSVDGQLSPCSKVLALDNRRLVARLGDVWHGLTQVAQRAELVGCAPLKQACAEAGIAEDFRGGCFVTNYQETGSVQRPSLQEHRIVTLQRQACGGCNACG